MAATTVEGKYIYNFKEGIGECGMKTAGWLAAETLQKRWMDTVIDALMDGWMDWIGLDETAMEERYRKHGWLLCSVRRSEEVRTVRT